MKAFVLAKKGEVKWAEVVEPTLPEPFGAILHPIAVSPCSSDVHTVYGGGLPKEPNLILGHECVAQVVDVASQVKDFKRGDIVVVPAITPDWRALSIQEGNDRHAEEHFSGHRLGRTRSGVFAEYFSIPDADTTIEHIPPNISIEQALMCADVVTTGFTGAEYANIKIGDSVCVIGIGPIGLMAIAGASLLGAAEIFAVGSRSCCIERAIHYGATEVLDYHNGDIAQQILGRTDEVGVDSVIIAGGDPGVLVSAMDMVRYGIGTISNISYFGGGGNLKFPKFSSGRGMAGKTIRMELARGGRVRMRRIMKMIAHNRVNPASLVTHTLNGFDKIGDALELMRKKPDNLIKVMVTTD